MNGRLRSDDLISGRHIYFCDNAKGSKKTFKKGIVLSRYPSFAVIEARSTFMGCTRSYNVCLNYADIDSTEPTCIIKESITQDEVETQSDITAEL